MEDMQKQPKRLPYTSPKLVVLGRVDTLTQVECGGGDDGLGAGTGPGGCS
ncbi:hypothetical protein RIF25_09075 [Thermosynechococcaceae cyanobacterium BACA0444]|uniref:RiPP n=1 Tax=Pseudocalidococcus azoricus BACA0444 TaxID=2918990 RepID=A0AAE4FU79_9CYAN|nr:hypothetical protein [Pseudocalidococcus azoricus]MDS3860965.1 hypothetical protein [Pseudocalidococcus azoricus BACA0444]